MDIEAFSMASLMAIAYTNILQGLVERNQSLWSDYVFTRLSRHFIIINIFLHMNVDHFFCPDKILFLLIGNEQLLASVAFVKKVPS